MINRLKIERFKSIRLLETECRRINLFIGEPNVGKSNILEALGLLSWCGLAKAKLKQFVRIHSIQELFYDGLIDEPICIEFQGVFTGVKSSTATVNTIRIKFEHNRFIIGKTDPKSPTIILSEHNTNGSIEHRKLEPCQTIKYYLFIPSASYNVLDPSVLIPPNGANLFSVIYSSNVLRDRMVELFGQFGLLVVMKQKTSEFAFQKQSGGIVTEFSFEVMSDTLQRMMFYDAAMESNQNSILAFEEPEAHAFPYYTKHLGERIAMDESNQYFIATHNPYLLNAVVEKANKNDVAVFITYLKDYETKVKLLTGDELGRLLDADPFFSIESFISGEGNA